MNPREQMQCTVARMVFHLNSRIEKKSSLKTVAFTTVTQKICTMQENDVPSHLEDFRSRMGHQRLLYLNYPLKSFLFGVANNHVFSLSRYDAEAFWHAYFVVSSLHANDISGFDCLSSGGIPVARLEEFQSVRSEHTPPTTPHFKELALFPDPTLKDTVRSDPWHFCAFGGKILQIFIRGDFAKRTSSSVAAAHNNDLIIDNCYEVTVAAADCTIAFVFICLDGAILNISSS